MLPLPFPISFFSILCYPVSVITSLSSQMGVEEASIRTMSHPDISFPIPAGPLSDRAQLLHPNGWSLLCSGLHLTKLLL